MTISDTANLVVGTDDEVIGKSLTYFNRLFSEDGKLALIYRINTKCRHMT